MKYQSIKKYYPKYTREEKLSCKLSASDVKNIKSSFKNGVGVLALSKKYGVARSTIYRYVNEKIANYGKEYRKNYMRQYRKDNPDKQKEVDKKFRERKKEIKPEVKEYFNKYREKNRDNLREYDRYVRSFYKKFKALKIVSLHWSDMGSLKGVR